MFCFDHNLRTSTYVEQKNTQSKTQKPIPQVHTDYTPTSAPRRLLDLTQKPKTNDSYASFRNPEDKEKPLISKELGKLILESWGTTFLPDFQPPLIFI